MFRIVLFCPFFPYSLMSVFTKWCFLSNLPITVGGLAFGRGNAKVRTSDKLSNSRKTFREHTPRMTPNRLLGVRAFISFAFLSAKYDFGKISLQVCTSGVAAFQVILFNYFISISRFTNKYRKRSFLINKFI